MPFKWICQQTTDRASPTRVSSNSVLFSARVIFASVSSNYIVRLKQLRHEFAIICCIMPPYHLYMPFSSSSSSSIKYGLWLMIVLWPFIEVISIHLARVQHQHYPDSNLHSWASITLRIVRSNRIISFDWPLISVRSSKTMAAVSVVWRALCHADVCNFHV